jgi:20S proteasome subunit beta 3
MVSNLLYEKRFGPYFTEPIIAGLDPKTFEPYISVMDLIGQECECEDFAVLGTSENQLYGLCESLWRPNMVR